MSVVNNTHRLQPTQKTWNISVAAMRVGSETDAYCRLQPTQMANFLVKAEFSTDVDKRLSYSSPDPDDDHFHINFTFFCKSEFIDWVLPPDFTEPLFLGQLNSPLYKYVFCKSLRQFDESRESIAQVFGRFPLTDNEWRRNMVELVFERAKETVRKKPRGSNILDLQFNVLVEHRHVIFDQSRPIVNSGMVPTVESSIESILKRKVIIDNNTEMMTCSICLEDFTEGLISMPCSHVFHGDCITQWLRTSHYCPICRFEMPTND
ncbi:hypothetical protein DH2020_045666 [Rehmannia glutinosa]|uniref:RING-type E3 ubiquitin transferase n=1 Tax=Rehmannia glutinosa TaxID=99300 RepID=A0ABR0UE92_REHGL